MAKPKRAKNESVRMYNERVSKEYYANGYHIKEIAKKLKINEVEVYNYVVDGHKITTPEEREEMINLYNKGYSIYAIAKIFNRSRACAKERIESAAKINCGDCNKLSDRQIKKMKDMANDGMSVKSIAKKLDISTGSVIYRLSHTGIRKPNAYVTKAEINKFIKLHKKGKSHAEIARICGRGRNTVCRHLNAAGYGRSK